MQPVPPTSYPDQLRAWMLAHKDDPDVAAQVTTYSSAIAVLMALDLEPVRPHLQRGYAASPRGGVPWDPVLLLRCLLLGILATIPSINALVPTLRGSRVLRAIAGLPDQPEPGRNASPGVGTFYDFLHRLHDGPRKPGVHPSEIEREAARAPRPPGNRPSKPGKKKGRGKRGGRSARDAASAEQEESRERPAQAALKLARELRGASLPDDLQGRLTGLLWELGVRPSAERGLLGDLGALKLCGDGSPLVTGASGLGQRDCKCNPRKSCDCDRRYADPDARSGWDAFRGCYYFGHHFYELAISTEGHDLPLLLRLDPGNKNDHVASIHAVEDLHRVFQQQRLGWRVAVFIADLGHDSAATHDLCADHAIRPVIPLSCGPAQHPRRPELKLSARGIPLCDAAAEMAPWGSSGKGHPAFCCPVKAGKLARCPIAPEDEPGWVCQPGKQLSPVVALNTKDAPRLFPEIHRNSATYEENYKLRSGCERSNAMKKSVMKLEHARHRRRSFWLIRLHLMAILQHAMAWVAEVDPRQLARELLGELAQAA